MRRLPLTSLALLAALAAPSAMAQQPAPGADSARLDVASDLVENLNLQQMMAQLVPSTSRNIVSVLAQNGEVNEQTRNTVLDTVRRQMATRLPDLIPLLAPVTAEAFTQEELEALNEFYSTEIGRSIVAKLPAYQGQSARLVANWMQQQMPAVEKAILDELDQKGIDVPRPNQQQPAAGTPAPAQGAQ